LRLALDSGDPMLVREFVLEWIPLVQARVARTLVRHREFSRDTRQEVEDVTQEVFATMFADGSKALRAWNPDRGLSLRNFIGLLAERHTITIVRSLRRSPWTESPSDTGELDEHMGEDVDQAEAVESKDFLRTLFQEVEEVLTPRGLELFERLLVYEESIDEVCASTGMSTDAVYAWRSRLIKVARTLGTELMQKMSSPRLRAAKDISSEA
jgi:DNA-directed RNA polymerase specialized sigma24 family protein